MERGSKARKLFGKVGLTSNVAQLAGTLKALRGLSEEDLAMIMGMTERSLHGSVDEAWKQVHVDVDLPLLKGGVFTLGITSLSKALQYAVNSIPKYRETLRELYRQRPCSQSGPYTLLLYADETTPGNIVNLELPRKLLIVSASIKELGPSILKVGAMWWYLAIIRTVSCKLIRGGGAAVWTKLLQQLFMVEEIATKGVQLDFGGGELVTFFFKMGNFLLDGDAIRMMYGSKGGRPKMPCIGCLNVVSDDKLCRGGLVALTTSDPSLFDIATDADIWQKADLLESARPAALPRLSMALGLNYVPEGFLWCKPLRPFIRPAACLTYDAMHVVLAQGVADLEYEQLLPRLAEEGIRWEHLHSYCQSDWRCPKSLGGAAKIRGAFSASKHTHWRSTGSFSLYASEHLALMPVMLHFLTTVAAKRCPGRLDKEIGSFRALAVVVALVKDGKMGASDADRLQRAAQVRAEAFARAYPNAKGSSHKQHWVHHLSLQLARDGFVLDCFVGERNQSVVKKAALSIENTIAFETSVSKRVLTHTLACLDDPALFQNRLLRPQPHAELGLVASGMMHDGSVYSQHDVVIMSDAFFGVCACAEVAGDMHFLAYQLEVVEQITPSAHCCRNSGSFQCFPACSSVRMAAAWYWADAVHIVVLVM